MAPGDYRSLGTSTGPSGPVGEPIRRYLSVGNQELDHTPIDRQSEHDALPCRKSMGQIRTGHAQRHTNARAIERFNINPARIGKAARQGGRPSNAEQSAVVSRHLRHPPRDKSHGLPPGSAFPDQYDGCGGSEHPSRPSYQVADEN
jgi:hypothetical protein